MNDYNDARAKCAEERKTEGTSDELVNEEHFQKGFRSNVLLEHISIVCYVDFLFSFVYDKQKTFLAL